MTDGRTYQYKEDSRGRCNNNKSSGSDLNRDVRDSLKTKKRNGTKTTIHSNTFVGIVENHIYASLCVLHKYITSSYAHN